MRLTLLYPRWVVDAPAVLVGVLPDGITDWNVVTRSWRYGMGLSFDCPHCRSKRLAVAFENPRDGGPKAKLFKRWWQRTGDTFNELTLTPSIDASGSGHWHGHITSGEVTP